MAQTFIDSHKQNSLIRKLKTSDSIFKQPFIKKSHNSKHIPHFTESVIINRLDSTTIAANSQHQFNVTNTLKNKILHGLYLVTKSATYGSTTPTTEGCVFISPVLGSNGVVDTMQFSQNGNLGSPITRHAWHMALNKRKNDENSGMLYLVAKDGSELTSNQVDVGNHSSISRIPTPWGGLEFDNGNHGLDVKRLKGNDIFLDITCVPTIEYIADNGTGGGTVVYPNGMYLMAIISSVDQVEKNKMIENSPSFFSTTIYESYVSSSITGATALTSYTENLSQLQFNSKELVIWWKNFDDKCHDFTPIDIGLANLTNFEISNGTMSIVRKTTCPYSEINGFGFEINRKRFILNTLNIPFSLHNANEDILDESGSLNHKQLQDLNCTYTISFDDTDNYKMYVVNIGHAIFEIDSYGVCSILK